jgi:hypothetical protein
VDRPPTPCRIQTFRALPVGLGLAGINRDATRLDILGGVNYRHENCTPEGVLPPHLVHN